MMLAPSKTFVGLAKCRQSYQGATFHEKFFKKDHRATTHREKANRVGFSILLPPYAERL